MYCLMCHTYNYIYICISRIKYCIFLLKFPTYELAAVFVPFLLIVNFTFESRMIEWYFPIFIFILLREASPIEFSIYAYILVGNNNYKVPIVRNVTA